MIAMIVALLAIGTGAGGGARFPSMPHPLIGLPTITAGNSPFDFYLVQGKTIVSRPFSSIADCEKALATLKSSLTPGADTMVCAHR